MKLGPERLDNDDPGKVKELGTSFEEVNAELPEDIRLEGVGPIKLRKDPYLEYYCVVKISEDGNHRVKKRTAKRVKEVLEEKTGDPWKIDNISNFVIHWVGSV